MSFALYDDALAFNKKVAQLRALGTPGIAALGLHVLANTWSRHEAQGGFIPDYIPDQLAGKGGTKLAQILDDVGMFDPCDGGWLIHDYSQYGPKGEERSAADRKREISEKRAAAGSKGGSKPEANEDQHVSNGEANRQQNGSPKPLPLPLAKSLQAAAANSASRLPDAAAAAIGLILEIRRQKSRVTDPVPWAAKMRTKLTDEHTTTLLSTLEANPDSTAWDLAEACGFSLADIAQAAQEAT